MRIFDTSSNFLFECSRYLTRNETVELLRKKKKAACFSLLVVFYFKLRGKISICLKECYRLYQIIRLLKRFHQVLDELHVSCGSLAPSVNDLCLVGVKRLCSYNHKCLFMQVFLISECLCLYVATRNSTFQHILQEPLALAQLQFEKFMALIESTIDIAYFKENGLYRILPNIDENLLAAAERMSEIEVKCNTLLKKVVFSSTYRFVCIYQGWDGCLK